MIPATESWVEDAVCNTIGGDAFFPDKSDLLGWSAAVRVCAGCPVRDLCLDYAMRLELGHDRRTRYGVFGGLMPPQRRRFEAEWLAGQTEAA